MRAREEPTIGAHEREGAIIVEAEVVDASVRGIEHPQPDELVCDTDVRVVGSVDEDRVAELTDGAEQRSSGVEGPVAVEPLVLQDHRDVVDAVAGRETGRDAVGVVEEEEPRDAAVHVIRGLLVRMGVIPERGGGLVDAPGRRPGLPGCDRLMGVPVGSCGQVHAVPVQGRRLGQAVVDLQGDLVAA